MATIQDFIKKHSIWVYFFLTFAISWGGLYLLSGGPDGFPQNKEEFEQQLPFFIPIVLAGPSAAGLLLTALDSGRAGFRELRSRLFKWRVGIGWYVIALLTGPLTLLAVLLGLSMFSPEFIPGIFTAADKASGLLSGIAAGLIVGIFEELGWTGFATPRLRRRYSALVTGLVVGVFWGAWHIFLNVIWVGNAYSGGLSPAFFMTTRSIGDLVGLLLAFRVLMVWVYDRTGSLLVAMLMHAGLTAITMIAQPAGIAGRSLIIYDVASMAVMWALAAVVVGAGRKRITYPKTTPIH